MIKAMTPIAEKAREIFEKRIKDWLDRNQEAMPFRMFCSVCGYRRVSCGYGRNKSDGLGQIEN